MNVASASVSLICTASGTYPLGITGVTDPSVQHQVYGGAKALSSSSTPPVTKSWEGEVALTAGTATLDLTALDQGDLTALDLTGEDVVAISIRGDDGQTAPITLSVAASNGYDIHGSGAGEEICSVEAGDEVLIYKDGNAPAVSSTVKDITLTGSGTEKCHVMILAGS